MAWSQTTSSLAENYLWSCMTHNNFDDNLGNIYACTINYTNETGKIYKSTNYGVSYSILTNSPNLQWSAIACSSNGNIIYAVASNSSTCILYKSTNGGDTFTNITIGNGFEDSECRQICCSNDGVYVYTCNSVYGYLFYSQNSGNTWVGYSLSYGYEYNGFACSKTGQFAMSNYYDNGIARMLIYTTNYGIDWNTTNVADTIYNFGITNDGLLAYGYTDNEIYKIINSDGIYSIIDIFNSLNNIRDIAITADGTNGNFASNFDDTTFVPLYIYKFTDTSTTQQAQQNYWTMVSSFSSGQYVVGGTDNFLYQSSDGGTSCFLEETEIELKEEIKNIEKININDLVKTTEGYKKVIYIGYSSSKDKTLFKVIKKNKIDVNVPYKDLKLSNGHSLLFDTVDNIKKDNYNENIHKLINTMKNYKKLLCDQCIYADEIIEDDIFKYYNIVLENDDEEGQYAIYANGVLTETMSIKHIKHSNLITKAHSI